MTVSIIILAYNQHEVTAECLRSIREHTTDYEIILVDNGSSPPIEDVGSVLIRNEENIGFPKAVNQGIDISTGEYIVLLNDDTIVTEGWLDHLKAHLEDFDIVGPMTNYAAGEQRIALPFYGDDEGLNKVATQYHLENREKATEVNFIMGLCMLFKRSLFDTLGPMDESLWPCSGEDIDYCFRAREMGLRVGIAKDVYIHHFGSQTLNDMSNKKVVDYVELCERNDKHLASKWGEGFWEKQKVSS